MSQTSSRITAALIFCAAFLPLAFLPARFEAHDTYRAGLLLIIVIFAIPQFSFLRQTNRLLMAVVLVWAAASVLSTLFSLSFSRAFFGDLIRDMGLITQLTLIGVILLGSRLNPGSLWRWFWLAGVTVAGYVMLQAAGFIPNPLAERVYGLLGAPTYTGGWLALIIVWVTIGGWSQRRSLSRFKAVVIAGGLLLMLGALLLTGSRGAVLAVGTGLLIALLVWTAVHKKRVVALALLSMTIIFVGGLFALNRMDWQNSLLATLPLISRLNPALPDTPRAAREKIWSGALNIARSWPIMTTTNGEGDASARLRPLIGYGFESFEHVFYPYVDDELRLFEGGHPVDRAHNDWLDTLVTGGWLGLVTRAGVWIVALYVGLSRLKLAGIGFLLLLAAGIIIGIIAGWNTPLLPLSATVGGLAALVLWLILQTFSKRPTVSDLRGWIAIAVLVAHIIDLQFFFTTLATAVPAYLALGMLLLLEQTDLEQSPNNPTGWLWIGFGGAWLVRSLVLIGANMPAYGLMAFMLAAVWLFVPLKRREMAKIILLWVIGWIMGQSSSAEITAVMDMGLLIAMLAKFVFSTGKQSINLGEHVGLLRSENRLPIQGKARLSASLIFQGGLLILAIGLWTADTVAQIYLKQAYASNSAATSANDLEIAVRVNPWDDKLWYLAGVFAYEAALNRLEAPDEATLNHAAYLVEQAMHLNPYDVSYPVQLAQIQQELAMLKTP